MSISSLHASLLCFVLKVCGFSASVCPSTHMHTAHTRNSGDPSLLSRAFIASSDLEMSEKAKESENGLFSPQGLYGFCHVGIGGCLFRDKPPLYTRKILSEATRTWKLYETSARLQVVWKPLELIQKYCQILTMLMQLQLQVFLRIFNCRWLW